jgi:nucleoid DNA-binding protein
MDWVEPGTIKIPAKTVVKIRPGKAFKEAIVLSKK